jgi:prophage regulatory protein
MTEREDPVGSRATAPNPVPHRFLSMTDWLGARDGSSNHPIFIPAPSAPRRASARSSIFWRRSLSIGLRLKPRRRAMSAKSEAASIKRTIRRQQLREMVPLADSTIYEMEQRGDFPRRFALSPRCVVWDLREVEGWLASRRSAPIPRAQHPDVTQRRSRPVKAPGRAPRAASTVG